MNAPKGNSYGHSADVHMHLTVTATSCGSPNSLQNSLFSEIPSNMPQTKRKSFCRSTATKIVGTVYLVNGIQTDRVKTAIESVSQ